MDEKDFLLKNIEENWIHARQSEDKRATIANLVLILTTLIQITLALSGFNRKVIPITLLLVVLGCYGIFSTIKLYERSQFHILRARALRNRLDELLPHAQVIDLQRGAEKRHQENYPVFYKVRLNTIWVCAHIVILILGLVETCICI